MKFPSLFKSGDTSTAAPWPWPACATTPRTLSFRLPPNSHIFKTMNTAYDLPNKPSPVSSPQSQSPVSIPPKQTPDNESAVIQGIRSDRLFFSPGDSNSILEEAKSQSQFHPYKTVTITAIDSDDPFSDFRASMEEMVEAHNLKEWDCLEELLTCYLKVNSKSNHGYIVGAFVDLLINLAVAGDNSDDCSAVDERCSSSSSSAATHYSFTSPLSFSSSSTYSSTSPCFSILENEETSKH